MWRWLLVPTLVIGCGGSASAPSETDAAVDTPVEDAADDAKEAAIDSGIAHPTPDELSFSAKNPLPLGEQILFNDWNGTPNAVWSMRPDGTAAVEIFRVHRVWAMGVSHGVDKIAFSSADPKQEERYGIKIGDAIQHTWVYDVASQKITPLTRGNLNDECHAFAADDKALFVCRRYDFEADGKNKGWRIARIDLASGADEFLTPLVEREFALGPQPTPDGKELWYSITKIVGASQKFSVMKMPLPSGAPAVVKPDASRPSLSPDGKRYVYSNVLDKSALHVANVDGSGDVKIASKGGTEVRWSPDGTRVVYTIFDAASSCSHVEIVKVDGSQADAPTRIRDCTKTKDFVTELAWVVKK